MRGLRIFRSSAADTKPQGATRGILLLGTPLLFGQITHYLHQIADSAMLGHYGEGSLELGAIGIAGLFTWILNTFLWPLSSGVQAITSRRFGRQSVAKDDESAVHTGEALDNGLVTALYASMLALGVSFLARPVLKFLISDPRILELCLQYIAVMRFALLPTGVFFVLQGFFSAVNKTSYVMYSGILSNLVNIALNWVLIFGHLGFPALGIRGAALGTALSSLVSMVYLCWILVFRGYNKRYRLFTFRHLSGILQKDIVRVALFPGIQNVVALAIFMIYQTIIEGYSTVYLAATHALFSFMRLNKTIIGGFARAAGILVGNALGRKDREEARRIGRAAALVGTTVAFVLVAVSLLARGLIARFFTNDPATQEAIGRAVLFFVGFYFIESVGFTFEMIFIANGYGRWVLFSESSTNLLFILGATLLSRYLFPDRIVLAWLSFGLYQIFHAFFMILGYFRGRWLDVEVEREKS
ncbi:MAG: MATE family efflux transporter [Spirochaetales bacterium]|nr:MATE family efflux transporter [Spirochaetales bacterium]